MKTITIFVTSIIILGNLAANWAEGYKENLEQKQQQRVEELNSLYE